MADRGESEKINGPKGMSGVEIYNRQLTSVRTRILVAGA